MRNRLLGVLGAALLLAGVATATIVGLAGAQTASSCRNVNAAGCSIEATSAYIAVVADRAVTTAVTSSDFTAQGFTGLRCVTNITKNQIPTNLTTTIQGKDDVTGNYNTLATKSSQNDTIDHMLTVGPGVYDESGVRVGSYLYSTYRVSVTSDSTSKVTYGVNCGRLP